MARPAAEHVEVATILARWAGLRSVTPVTRVPSRMVLVRAASHASVVQLSGRSSHGRPTWGICTMWSITHRLVKPTASAIDATSATRSAQSGPPPVPANDDSCKPNRRAAGLDGGGASISVGTISTAAAACTASNPSDASSRAAWSLAVNWAASTLGGTGRARDRLRARQTSAGVSNTTAWQATRCRRARLR